MSKGHGLSPGYRAGDNWITCQRCGFERRASQIAEEWNGLEVCKDTCFETRHPQDFLRVKEERITPARTGYQVDLDASAVDINGDPIGLA